MGSTTAFELDNPAGLSPVEEEGYGYFARILKWYSEAPPPTGLDTELRPTDVIVTSYPKSGTTLVQQICYQIAVATGGASPIDPTGTEFTDFNVVSPWLEHIHSAGLVPCETFPRTFKSHAPMSYFADKLKCKHIVILRNPIDIPASAIDFLFGAVIGDDEKMSDEVLEATFNAAIHGLIVDGVDIKNKRVSRAFLHMQNNISVEDDRVLILCYENVVKNLEETIKLVAKFMECDLSDEGLKTVLKRCDRTYMANNKGFAMISEAKVLSAKGKPCMKAKLNRKTGFKKFKIKEEVLPLISEQNKIVFGADYHEYCSIIRERELKRFS